MIWCFLLSKTVVTFNRKTSRSNIIDFEINASAASRSTHVLSIAYAALLYLIGRIF